MTPSKPARHASSSVSNTTDASRAAPSLIAIPLSATISPSRVVAKVSEIHGPVSTSVHQGAGRAAARTVCPAAMGLLFFGAGAAAAVYAQSNSAPTQTWVAEDMRTMEDLFMYGFA